MAIEICSAYSLSPFLEEGINERNIRRCAQTQNEQRQDS